MNGHHDLKIDEWLLDFGRPDNAWQMTPVVRVSGERRNAVLEVNRYLTVALSGQTDPKFFVGRDLCHPGANIYPEFSWRPEAPGRYTIKGQFALRSAANGGGGRVVVTIPERFSLETRFLFGELATLMLDVDLNRGDLVNLRIDYATHLLRQDTLFNLSAERSIQAPHPERIQLDVSIPEGWCQLAAIGSLADLRNGLDPAFQQHAATAFGSKDLWRTPPAELWAEAQRIIQERAVGDGMSLFSVKNWRGNGHE